MYLRVARGATNTTWVYDPQVDNVVLIQVASDQATAAAIISAGDVQGVTAGVPVGVAELKKSDITGKILTVA